jgi:hypothetical protein
MNRSDLVLQLNLELIGCSTKCSQLVYFRSTNTLLRGMRINIINIFLVTFLLRSSTAIFLKLNKKGAMVKVVYEGCLRS